MTTYRNNPAFVFLGEKAELLVFGGLSGTSSGSAPLASAELYNPLDQTWSATGSLNVARQRFTTTVVSLAFGPPVVAGRVPTSAKPNLTTSAVSPGTEAVLAAGGVDASGDLLDSAELYDPISGVWTPTGPMNRARADHGAVLLVANGEVLVAGGLGGALGSPPGSPTNTAELFNPASQSWALTGALSYPRASFALAELPQDGAILAYLGKSGTGTSPPLPLLGTSEAYNPYTGAWTTTGSLSVPRTGSAVVRLPDGRILRLGGKDENGKVLGSAEAYQEQYPGPAGWATIASMTTARAQHGQLLLANGDVLVAGGLSGAAPGTPTTASELYSPGTGSWAATTAALNVARANFTLTELPSGIPIAAGGVGVAGTAVGSAERYNPSTGVWSVVSSMHQPRAGHRAVFLAALGELLVAGGSPTPSAELYNPLNDTWTITGPMTSVRINPSLALLDNGQVLVAGGADQSGVILRSTELYNPSTNQWTAGPPMTTARVEARAVSIGGGRVLLVGGLTGAAPGAATNAAEIYDPTANTWTPTTNLPAATSDPQADLVSNGRVLVTGGFAAGGAATNAAALYDPRSASVSSAGAMQVARGSFRTTVLPTGQVLATGGIGSDGSILSSAEVYQPGPPLIPRFWMPLLQNAFSGGT